MNTVGLFFEIEKLQIVGKFFFMIEFNALLNFFFPTMPNQYGLDPDLDQNLNPDSDLDQNLNPDPEL